MHKESEKNCISINYEAKITGLEKTIQKIDDGKYQLSAEEKKALMNKLLPQLGLFQLLKGDTIKGRGNLRRYLDWRTKKSLFDKYYLLYLFSHNRLLMNINLSLARSMWRQGLIKL